jgi:hypothetical protein
MRFTHPNAVTAYLAFWLLLTVLPVMSCKPTTWEPKSRPSGVPKDALWFGGPDGGAYVRCTVDVSRDVNPCEVWNDFTGGLVESGDYRLEKEKRAATASELQPAFPDFGGRILLKGGMVLRRQGGLRSQS